MQGNANSMEDGRYALKISAGNPNEKKLLRSPRRRWEVNIQIDLNEISVNRKN